MKEKMNDNRKVNDNHQKGIERVKNIKMPTGQGGKMGNAKEKNGFHKSGTMTPRQG